MFNQIADIAAAGMNLHRLRAAIATQNLANANTVAMPNGQVYQARQVTAVAMPHQVSTSSFTQWISAQSQKAILPQAVITTVDLPARVSHEPGHPFADAAGYVRYANVDTTSEMLTLMNASRHYEATVVALNIARGMAARTLEIGGQS